MNIKRYEIRGGRSGLEEATGPLKPDRQVVLLSDHIASQAYDEDKERELFHNSIASEILVQLNTNGDYRYVSTRDRWYGWKTCAKSRARSAV